MVVLNTVTTLNKRITVGSKCILIDKSNEDWSKSGTRAAGFFRKNILWNKPTVEASVNDLNGKYKDIRFRYKRCFHYTVNG